jgi:hypothetical protein
VIYEYEEPGMILTRGGKKGKKKGKNPYHSATLSTTNPHMD